MDTRVYTQRWKRATPVGAGGAMREREGWFFLVITKGGYVKGTV